MWFVLLMACAGKDDAVTDDTGQTPVYPDLPVSDCGREPYDWVSLNKVGAVVDWELMEDWTMSASGVAGLARLAGLEDTSKIRYGVRTYRVRYVTQDRGALTEATGIVSLPDDPGASPPSLLYLHPTTGFEDFCAPSGRDILWAAVPMVLASLGAAVAAPDYLGQNGFGAESDIRHPYLAAEPTAVVSLDMLRAMWAFAGSSTDPDLDLSPTRDTLLVGSSQGGGGVFWAERYAPEYLPEASLFGTLSSVPTLDLVAWADEGGHALSVASVGVPFALSTMRDWYGLDAPISDVVVTDQIDRMEEEIETDCPSAVLPDDITSLDQIYTASWQDTVNAEDLDPWSPWSCMLAESSVGRSAIPRTGSVPTLVILGGEDTVALTAAQHIGLDALCAEGEPIVAVECEGLDHTAAVEATFGLQLNWLSARLDGEAITDETCGEIQVMDCSG